MKLPGKVTSEVRIGSGGKGESLERSPVIIFPGAVTRRASSRMDSPLVAEDLSEIAFLKGQGKGFEECEDLVGGLIG